MKLSKRLQMIKQFLKINMFFLAMNLHVQIRVFQVSLYLMAKKIKKNINQSMKTTTKKETMLIELY